MRRISIAAIFMILSVFSLSVSAQNTRGFYITNVHHWIGDATQESNILEYAQGNGFNYLLFYDLGFVNWTSSTVKNNLASFFSRARSQYGIVQIGAVVENYSFIPNYILPYNNTRAAAAEKFDVINQEFEFWSMPTINSSYCSRYLTPNGMNCDTASAFLFAWTEFQKIDSLTAANGMMSEYYLGWPNQGQMQKIASRADRILLHSYRPTDSDVYSYSRSRLIDIASLGALKKVISLFSAEPVFMGPWLNSNPQNKPFQTYSNDLTLETSSFKQFIDLQGYQWFTYYHLPKTILPAASISSNGPLSFCNGGSVTLTSSSGMQYLWSPGGQTTQSISVSTPGSYTVRVTNSAGVHATSSPAVVSIATTTAIPSVTANGATSFCPGGSVVLTSSFSGTNLWSTGDTSQSITVTTPGSYTVLSGDSSCMGSSTPVEVTLLTNPQPPVITSTGPLNVCVGSSVTLTSTVANSYLWSTGANTQTIIINTPGSYQVRAFNGPTCSALSSVVNVTISSPPPQPVITATSSTITASNPVVMLSSSSAGAYHWSTGHTSQSIPVFLAGAYFVTVFDNNGCFSNSDTIIISSKLNKSPVKTTVSNRSVGNDGDDVSSLSLSSEEFTTVFKDEHSMTPLVYKTRGADAMDSEYGYREQRAVSAYPNPATISCQISFNNDNDEEYLFSLMDQNGKQMRSHMQKAVQGANNFQIDLTGITPGIYLALLTGSKSRLSAVILIQ